MSSKSARHVIDEALGLGSCCPPSDMMALRQKGVIVAIPGATDVCSVLLAAQGVDVKEKMWLATTLCSSTVRSSSS